MADQVTPAPGPGENNTDLSTRWAELTVRSRQRLLGPFANIPTEGPPPLSGAEELGDPPSALFPPDPNWGDEDFPEHDDVERGDDGHPQIPVPAKDTALSGRDGASEQTRKGSEATVVEADTTPFWSNPLLRKAQMDSIRMKYTGALSFWRSRWGKSSHNEQFKGHDTQQEVFRAPQYLPGVQGTNGQAGQITSSLTVENLIRLPFPGFQPNGDPDTATRDDSRDGSNNSEVPKWVKSLPPPEEQVDASVERPGGTERSGEAHHDAAVPEAKAHTESGMNKPERQAVAVSRLNPSNNLMSKANGNPNEHRSLSTESTAARALSAGETEEDAELASAWNLDFVQRLIPSREETVRGVPGPRVSVPTMSPEGKLTIKTGTPGEVMCELLSDFRKAERPSSFLAHSLTLCESGLKPYSARLSPHEVFALNELCDLTKAFNGLRAADKSYEEVFGSKWMEPSGIPGCSSDLTRAIQEDARAPINLTKDGLVTQIAEFISRPDGSSFWGRRLSRFLEARSRRADARRVLNTVYHRDKARTKMTKSRCTAASVSKHNPGAGHLQKLPPWRPSLFSANAHRLGQVSQHCEIDAGVKTSLNWYRAAGHLMTALEAVEAGPGDIFGRDDWRNIYQSSAGELKSVHEKQQITSLEEGLPEAKRKHMTVWSRALQSASSRLYDEKSDERKQEGVKRIKEHLDANPPEFTLTQLCSKAGDKPAYTWNEDEDVITEHLATSALEWNLQRGGSYTLGLHDQDDLSRAPLRKVMQEFTNIEQKIGKLGQMRMSRQERATNLSKTPPSTITPAEEKSTTPTAPATGGAIEAKSVVGSKWEPDDDELRVLGPLRDAKDRIEQVLGDVRRLDGEFSSKLAMLRKQLDDHEATQSDQGVTRAKSQILSLLDTWTTYTKYDRSRQGLQDLDENAHDYWTDFFSRSKGAFADRRALIPDVQDLVKKGYEGVSTLCARERANALSVPFDEAKDAINEEENAMLSRLRGRLPQTPDEKILWTSAFSKLTRHRAATLLSQANEATKASQHDQANTTSDVAESSSLPPQSDVSEPIKTSESSTVPSSAGTSDVSNSTLTGSTLST